MSGICSAHKEFVAGCPACKGQEKEGRMERPTEDFSQLFEDEKEHSLFLEELLKALCGDGWGDLTLCGAQKKRDYTLALEARLTAEQTSVNELSLHCQDLGARLKRAEEALVKLRNLASRRIPYDIAKEALKGLGKEVKP